MGKFVPFGEWLPDLPALDNNGATIARNVIPDVKSYRPFPSPVPFTSSLNYACRGAIIARDAAGNYYNYAGDAVRLYSLAGLTWNNVTRVSSDYTTPSDAYWEFTQFGNIVVGVNGATGDDPQAISVGAANFIDLGGGPPKASHIASVRDFVVMGNTTSNPQQLKWCAINNVLSWTASAATLADSQTLPGDGGHIQKVVGGEYGTILQERAIFRMEFVGSPLIFQFPKVQTNIGTLAPQSVVSYRNFIFFLSEDGFYQFDGSNVTPIGVNKVDRTFFNDIDITKLHRIHAAIDPVRKIVAWAYPAHGNVEGNCNRMLIYNWGSERWSRIEDLNIELLFRHATTAITLDDLDAIEPDIDAMQVSFDSPQWSGGNYQLGAFGSTHALNAFNGSSMPATVETGEHQFNRDEDGLTYITEVRPITEGLFVQAQVSIGTRIKNNESHTYTTAVTPGSSGFASVRSTGRYHRFRMTTNGGDTFEHLQGIDIVGTADGIR